jgi:hypothetical protein
MSATAKTLRADLVERERVLDEGFAKGNITPDQVTTETTAIAFLQGWLRDVHLTAHIETRGLLNAGQIARYQQSRLPAKKSASQGGFIRFERRHRGAASLCVASSELPVSRAEGGPAGP